MGSEPHAPLRRGKERTLRAHLQGHQRGAESEVEIDDGIWLGEPGELLRIIEAWQQDIATGHGGVDLPTRGFEIPQAQPQVRVVGDLHAGGTRRLDGGTAGLARSGADRLADGRQMQELRTGDVARRHVGRLHQRSGGILAQIVELVAGRGVGDEADAGRRAGMAADAGRIEPFGLPQIEEGVAHPILPDTGDVAGRGSLARRGDRHVLRIATEALQPGAPVAFARPVEFDQRFADGDDGGRGAHRAGFPCHRAKLKRGAGLLGRLLPGSHQQDLEDGP